jgi:hypothetical protein
MNPDLLQPSLAEIGEFLRDQVRIADDRQSSMPLAWWRRCRSNSPALAESQVIFRLARIESTADQSA